MLVSRIELKDFLNVQSSQIDDFIDVISQEAQEMVETWLNRKFESANYTKDFSGDGTDTVILDRRPVTAVSQVLVSISGISEIAASGYEFFSESGILQLKSNIFPSGIKNCRVAYTAGFTSTTVPVALELAIKEVATLIYKGSPRGEGRLGKSSINQPDGGTVNYVHELPKATRRMLSRYRDLRF